MGHTYGQQNAGTFGGDEEVKKSFQGEERIAALENEVKALKERMTELERGQQIARASRNASFG